MLIPQTTYQPLVQLEKINYYKEDFLWNYVSQPFGNYIADCRLGKKKIQRICAAWDAATGLKGRDNSVLSICAKDEDNNVYVHDVAVFLQHYIFAGQSLYLLLKQKSDNEALS